MRAGETLSSNELPRPDFRRAAWQNLNGRWRFAFDDEDSGSAQHWERLATTVERGEDPFDREIVVPFAYQAPLSGVGDRAFHDVCWYARAFEPALARDQHHRLVLHLGAVDYQARVWVNGQLVCEHEGGQTPFSADITEVARPSDNVLVIRVEDPSEDLTIPRGKQYWKEQSDRIFYTRTTGIWQTVWLETVPENGIDRVRIIPDLDRAEVNLQIGFRRQRPGSSLRVTIKHRNASVASERAPISGEIVSATLALESPGAPPLQPWSPEAPNLYDLRLEVVDADGSVLDTVDSYFGVRKIETRGDAVFLNNRPYFQRLVLDQGYFADGLLTAPSDDDLRRDIELAKAMGFNGARKHQKVEDPRWLYWADRLGFLVWGEMANANLHSPDGEERLLREWAAAVERDRDHPCIVAWVPLNESWGVPPEAAAQAAMQERLYRLTHSLDDTRPVVSNDGWEHATTDLCTLHDYDPAPVLAGR